MARIVAVKTGISDYDNIEITSDLSDTANVITGPFLVVSKRLKDGDYVKLKEEKNKKEDEETEE